MAGDPNDERTRSIGETHWGNDPTLGDATPSPPALDPDQTRLDAPGAGRLENESSLEPGDDSQLTHMSAGGSSAPISPDDTYWTYAGQRRGVSRPQTTVGQSLGQYELREVLGQGGMGAVYKAWQPDAQRHVALKVITGTLSKRARERFLREGQVAAQLQHSGIVDVHAVGEHDGLPYLACELVPQGPTFRDELRTADLALNVTRVRDAALALGYAHEQGLVHRDVKPDNLLLNPDGRIQVADFGLVYSEELDQLTQTGTFLGTPAYAAPEAEDRSLLGPPTDVWALGVILYEAMTRTRPFTGETAVVLRNRIVTQDPVSPRSLDSGLPEPLERICLKALRKDPTERYPNGAALAEDLQRYLDGEHVLARRRRSPGPLLVVGAILIAGAVLAVVAGWGGQSTDEAEPTAPPPSLRLEPVPDLVGAAELTLHGEATGETWCLVTVAGAPPRRLRPDTPFSLRVPLEPGLNELEVTIEDAAGRRGDPIRLSVRRVPEWYLKAPTPPLQRVSLPLPEGMRLGPNENEYVWTRRGLTFTLVWVPAASFRFGLGNTPMSLTRGFWIGKHEITWAQVNTYLATKPKVSAVGPQETDHTTVDVGIEEDTVRLPEPVPAPDDTSVFYISWIDAQRFCAWVDARLPTEAEWELAAEGLQNQRFPWGESRPRPGQINSRLPDEYPYISPPGVFLGDRSPFGCLDMAGNAQEWVADRWAKSIPDGPLIDYAGPSASSDHGNKRVVRGGSWRSRYVRAFETSSRLGRVETEVHLPVGLRICISEP